MAMFKDFCERFAYKALGVGLSIMGAALLATTPTSGPLGIALGVTFLALANESFKYSRKLELASALKDSSEPLQARESTSTRGKVYKDPSVRLSQYDKLLSASALAAEPEQDRAAGLKSRRPR